jgi:hypothetical protein
LGLSFEELTFTQVEDDTLISVGDTPVATFLDTETTAFAATDFAFT